MCDINSDLIGCSCQGVQSFRFENTQSKTYVSVQLEHNLSKKNVFTICVLKNADPGVWLSKGLQSSGLPTQIERTIKNT